MSDLISAHCAHLRAEGYSNRTVGEREYWLRLADRQLEYGVVDADRTELTGWLGNPSWSAWTRTAAHYHLSSFYLWGCDPGNAADPDVPVLDDNPMAGIRRPRVTKGEPRPVSDAELDHILEHAREPYLTAAVLATFNALRADELARLDRVDVDQERLYVRRGKGGKAASVPTSPVVWAWISDFPRGSVIEHVGGVADGRRMSMRASAYFSRSLNLPGVCLHRLRHTHARLLREQGADIATISRALRHEHLSSTQVYARATEAECRLAVHALRSHAPAPSR